MTAEKCLEEAKGRARAAGFEITYQDLLQTGTVPLGDLSAYRRRRLRARLESWITRKRLPTDLWKSDTPPSRQIDLSPST